MCGELLAFEEVVEVECPIWQLKKNNSDTPFPMLPRQFNESMLALVEKYSSQKAWDPKSVVVVDGQVRAMTIKVHA